MCPPNNDTRPGSTKKIREIVPDTNASITSTDADLATWLRQRYDTRPAPRMRMNLVTAVNGVLSGSDGTSDTLSSRLDRRIVHTIRELCDVVLLGAGTVRAEKSLGLRGATVAVVTSSPETLDHLPRHIDDTSTVLILCPRDATTELSRNADNRIRLIPLDADSPLPAKLILSTLNAHGYHTVVCEGGLELAKHMIAADIPDEYCVTISPRFGPTASPHQALPTPPGPQELCGHLVDSAGFSYLRFQRR